MFPFVRVAAVAALLAPGTSYAGCIGMCAQGALYCTETCDSDEAPVYRSTSSAPGYSPIQTTVQPHYTVQAPVMPTMSGGQGQLVPWWSQLPR